VDDNEIRLSEWKEVRETLRYFGNKRFAQLTVFIAAEGVVMSAFFNPANAGHHLVLQVVGLFLAAVFFVMEYSSVTYWDAFAKRGEAIEKDLPLLKLMSEYRPKERALLSGTKATFFLYLCTGLFWLASFGCYWRAHGVESLSLVVAGDGSAEYPWAPAEKKRYEDSEGINKKITAEIAQAVLREKAQMLLWTGDLVNVNEENPETFKRELLAWRNIMQPLYDHGVIVLPVRGNHEVTYYTEHGPLEGTPIPESAKIWNEVFSGQYALPSNGPDTEKNLSFYCIRDSVLAIGLDQYQNQHAVNRVWLNEVLENYKRPFIFAYGHEPAFMAGCHRDNLSVNPAERDLMWESLIQAGARVYFCGHDHFYDHMKIVRSSGDPGPEMHQITAGTAGAPFYEAEDYVESPGWKLMRVARRKTYGYILITIDKEGATIAFKERVSPGQYKVMDAFSYIASVP